MDVFFEAIQFLTQSLTVHVWAIKMSDVLKIKQFILLLPKKINKTKNHGCWPTENIY